MNEELNKSEKINLFIKLAGELLSKESMQKLVPVLLKDCKVMLDIGITGLHGEPGYCTLSSEEISSLMKELNIEVTKSGEFVILPHSFKNSLNDWLLFTSPILETEFHKVGTFLNTFKSALATVLLYSL